MTTNIHVGDIGTVITETVVDSSGSAINISSATSKKLYLEKPDGSRAEKTADFVTDGTDGKIKYALIDGDINQRGYWSRQWRVVLSTGTWTSETVYFEVDQVI